MRPRTAKEFAEEAQDRAEAAAGILARDDQGPAQTRTEAMLFEVALSLSSLSKAVALLADKQRR